MTVKPNNETKLHKTKVVSFRVSAEENRIFELLAKDQGISVSEFFRMAGMTIAEMSLDNKDFLKALGKEPVNALGKIESIMEATRDILANSIKESNALMTMKMERLEKVLDAFLYAYLFHTPEVNDQRKQHAMQSAVTRKKKVLSLVENDKGG